MSATPQRIVEFLGSYPQNVELQPVTLTIEGVTYPAARFVRAFVYKHGMAVVQQGKVAAGATYLMQFLYVGGAAPADVRSVYAIAGEPHEWFRADIFGPDGMRRLGHGDPSSPLGDFFMLTPWDLPRRRIDHPESPPYRRIPAVLAPA